MKNLENNKILSAIVIAGLIAIVTGKIADGLYHPVEEVEKRGYMIEVASASSDSPAAPIKEEVKIDIVALMSEADAEAGKKQFKKCASCHSIDQGGPNKVGPALYGTYGSGKAQVAGYNYSKALAEKGGNWDDEALFEFLKKPRKYIPKTKMGFAGIKKPKDIANLVAYLKSNK